MLTSPYYSLTENWAGEGAGGSGKGVAQPPVVSLNV